MCGYLSNLLFSALLAICPGFVLAAETQKRTARERSNDRDVQIRDRTVKVKDKIHLSVFSLSVDNTGESRYLLFNEYLCVTVRLNDIRKTSGYCCVPAVNTSSITT